MAHGVTNQPATEIKEPALGHKLALSEPLVLQSGATIESASVAYQTYGTLNTTASNCILVCHALTGDQYVAGMHPTMGKPGWWDGLVGAGKVIDTNRFFVVCANVLGGCMGSTGPKETNPATGQSWGLTFPVITIRDMVQAQVKLIDYLGVDKVFCVVGGSMGAMQVLEWAHRYPHRVFSAVPIAGSYRHSAQNIAFHEVGRQAITADPDWSHGNYLEEKSTPKRGLAVARMAAHITYMSEKALHRKFGRRLQDRVTLTYGFDADFQVESYLRHQGYTFVDRFDANSYLYITRAMDYFDLAQENNGVLAAAFKDSPVRFCLISFSSDWLFPTSESRAIVRALNAVPAKVSFVEVESDKGHDAFLLDESEFHQTLQGFIEGAAAICGLAADRSAVTMSAERTDASGRADTFARPRLRIDLQQAADLVPSGSRVLDVGCGDGTLLAHLKDFKQVDGRGLELSMGKVRAAVSQGLPVIQGNLETDLSDYPVGAFDYVILSQTLQATHSPRKVMDEMLRVGQRAIVSFPNFGHWRVRLAVMYGGRMPTTPMLSDAWFNTPNIHLCTILDFIDLCREMQIRIEHGFALDALGRQRRFAATNTLANAFSEQALFVLTRV